MPVNVNPSDIVDNLTSMGYTARHFQKDADGDKPAKSSVYINTGTKNVSAYIDLSGEAPRFRVWAEYPATGHTTTTGRTIAPEDIKRFNAEESDRVRRDLTGPALAATSCAMEGGDLKALCEGFGLAPSHDRYKPKQAAEATADAEGPKTAAPASAPAM